MSKNQLNYLEHLPGNLPLLTMRQNMNVLRRETHEH